MFEASIRSALLADAALVALIGERVRPIQLSQKERRPSVAYNVGDRDDPSPSHDGPSSFTRVTYDVIAIGPTYEAVANISEHVRRLLKNFAGTAGGCVVVWTRFQAESDIEQDTAPGEEKPVFVRSQTYRAMYRAAD